MRVIAPGKLVLTGAYAVLHGAPAIVAAVDRHAVADASRAPEEVTPEIRAAFGDAVPPHVDVSALHDAVGRKLGLGSSAASVVAALGAAEQARGEDIRDPEVRGALFRAARAAHARAQSGGSGVDIAASVYGGVLRYTLVGQDVVTRSVVLPRGTLLAAFDTGTSVRTSDLIARVEATRTLRARESAALAGDMAGVATAAADAVEAGEGPRFVSLARAYGWLLERLGRLADAPIVPAPIAELGALAEQSEGAFFPSGAGGGDLCVWLGPTAPPADFVRRAGLLGLSPLPLSLDPGGVRPMSTSRSGDPDSRPTLDLRR